MTCRMGDLRNKEVINVRDGERLGFVCDIELDTRTAQLTAIVIYGRLRLLGLLGREPDLVIPWSEIRVIGAQTVLVSFHRLPEPKNRSGWAKFLEKIGF